MHVAMERDELVLFQAFLSCSRKILEFGTGGSTWTAAQVKRDWIVSIDSSVDWLQKVAEETKDLPTAPELLHVDIGPTREWGYPLDETHRSKWPDYHRQVWRNPKSCDADLFFVDGRFRVACVLQCIMHLKRRDAIIGVHDYCDRPHYHVVERFLQPIAAMGRMSFFRPIEGLKLPDVEMLLKEYEYEPA